MAFFENKPIFLDEETVAEQLRRTRQAKELKLPEVAKKLKIRFQYLDALEKGRYSDLPKGVYGRNFLREYASFLGLDYKALGRQYALETGEKAQPAGKLFERQIVSKRHLIALPLLVRNAIIGVLILASLAYLGFLLQQIFEPPKLVIDYPPENFITSERSILMRGSTEPEADVRINDQSVLADGQGRFERELYLQTGLNTIVVTSKKKYSRTAQLSRQVLVQSAN